MTRLLPAACSVILGTLLGLPEVTSVPAQPPAPDIGALPSTFASTGYDRTWDSLFGEWASDSFRVVLLPRSSGSAGATLYGAIPDGPFEGVLLLQGSLRDAKAALTGTLIRAEKDLRHSPISLTRTFDGIRLAVGGRALDLRRLRDANRQRLAQIAIIAHRGLSLNVASLMNSSEAIAHAWLFGASGVELDITVPYERRGRETLPRADDLRIYHPPVLRSELIGFDTAPRSTLQGTPTVRSALAEAARHNVPLVYLDPKLRWLVKDHQRDLQGAIDGILAAALDAVRNDGRLHVLVGAETREAAEQLAARPWPAGQSRIGWASELTKGTGVDAFLAGAESAGGAPAAVSLNLMRIRDGGTGLLGWFLRDIGASAETRIARLRQPVIVWTAATPAQFEGALRAIERFLPGGSSRSAGIITPFPHRLAWYLATAPSSSPTKRSDH